ncbi:MAG TPA: endolytic transglycosylase MltG [Nitrospinota bacterium]|nr:endolytic transglycosylase MltG [Nitrospinota bacterium]
MKNKKRQIIPLLLIFLSIVVFISMAYIDISVNTPQSSFKQIKKVEIPKGYSLKKIARLLNEQNLIKNYSIFITSAYLRGISNKLKSGEYELSTDMTPLEIMEKLYKGEIVYYKITIPEGYNIKNIANLLEKNELINKEKFISLTQDREFLSSLGIKAISLEGYLFPDTYYFSKGMTEEEIINKMIESLNNLFTEKLQKRLQDLNFTIHKILTLASLIEKEAQIDSERKLVSAVFHNRLKSNMLLQSDPTVIYALEDFDGNLKKQDLSYDSPYNTYLYPGLPPTPIANPGTDSIMAALYPADVDYLYFVSKNNGEHHFSSTFKEHNEAVKKFQLKR